ncbi:MAG: hypothetical protein ABJ056_01120 [Halioglobus sp.]
MKVSKMFPGKFKKAADYPTPVTETIKVVYKELVGQERDEKLVCYFEGEDQRGLVLNKTNAMSMAGMYGDDTDEWKGKKVDLYATQVPFGTKIVDSIRVDRAGARAFEDDIPDFAS